MSGGVDSAVAAALLKKQGFDVTGVFMKLFKEADPTNAKKVAKKMDIPFKIFDFRKEFKRKVIDYFLKGYRQGITPNPCIVCNRDIKFGLFFEKALKMGADYMATGHYARKSELTTNNSQLTTYKLLRAKDKNKDQSYFLWTLTQRQLRKTLFPIGDYTKKEVRKMAKKLGISDLIKGESEDICFVGNTNVREYLRTRINTNKGEIITVEGKVVGEHEGLAFYTIGQRKGIKIAAKIPYYVIRKDIKNNNLIVSQNSEDLLSKNLIATEVNWILGGEPELPLKIRAKIRYRSEAAPAILVNCLRSKVYSLKFGQPQRAITPGQSVVFYLPAEASAKTGKGKELLGGGIIQIIEK